MKHKKFLASKGRQHCRQGIKPVLTTAAYLDGYSRQYVRENQTIYTVF